MPSVQNAGGGKVSHPLQVVVHLPVFSPHGTCFSCSLFIPPPSFIPFRFPGVGEGSPMAQLFYSYNTLCFFTYMRHSSGLTLSHPILIPRTMYDTRMVGAVLSRAAKYVICKTPTSIGWEPS